MPRILVLSPHAHGRLPSQRFRFEQYLERWRQDGFEVVQEPFWDEAAAAVLHQPGHTREKLSGFARGLLRRARGALTGGYDHVFVHLGAVPVGPPLFEALYKLRGAHVIFDLDDALFLGTSSNANPLAKFFRSGAFIKLATRLADRVVVVNPYLETWARRFNDDVRLIPTTIDPDIHRPPPAKTQNARPVLGWTGTFTTTVYLEVIRPFLRELQNTHDFTLRVICNTDPGFPELKHYEFVPWRKETEIEDLWPIDIGLMPLDDGNFGKGKVGFKAIQYSALGIPPVVSDEGSGREVVEDGVTGFAVANTSEAWCTALRTLLDDPALRARMGEAARTKILGRYAVPAQAAAYRALFE